MLEAFRESTWGVPVIGALHVLCVAVFAGSVLSDAPQLRRMRAAGLVLLAATGLVLMAANPERTWESRAFWIKTGLLAAALLTRGPKWMAITLWAGVIAAARGIAYF